MVLWLWKAQELPHERANRPISAETTPRAIMRLSQTTRGGVRTLAWGSRAISASGCSGISGAGREGSSTAPQ